MAKGIKVARTAKTRSEGQEAAPRERIIAAAEGLFARKGFYGTPVREIAREASINVNLVSYYFPSKEDLYNAVVDVRAICLNKIRDELLDALEEAHTPEPAPVEAIIHSFVHPFFELRSQDEEGWSNWSQLLRRETGTELWHRVITRALGPVLRRYVYTLHRAVPSAKRADILFILELSSVMSTKFDAVALVPDTVSSEWTDNKIEDRIIRSLIAATLAFGVP